MGGKENGIDLETIGGRAKSVRLGKNLSQREIAEAMELQTQSYSALELNRNSWLDKHLVTFSHLTGVNLHWLLTGHENVMQNALNLKLPLKGFSNTRGRYVPMLHSKHLDHYPLSSVEEIVDKYSNDLKFVLSQFDCSAASFDWTIENAANAPDYIIGDRVIIDPMVKPEPGDMILVRENPSLSYFFGSYDPVVLTDPRDFNLSFKNERWPGIKSAQWVEPLIIGVMMEHTRPRRRG